MQRVASHDSQSKHVEVRNPQGTSKDSKLVRNRSEGKETADGQGGGGSFIAGGRNGHAVGRSSWRRIRKKSKVRQAKHRPSGPGKWESGIEGDQVLIPASGEKGKKCGEGTKKRDHDRARNPLAKKNGWCLVKPSRKAPNFKLEKKLLGERTVEEKSGVALTWKSPLNQLLYGASLICAWGARNKKSRSPKKPCSARARK